MKISILDCTLRDGGYINNFHFGVNRIQTIKEKLYEANIEIIECGFLKSGCNDPDCSLYGSVEQVRLPAKRGNQMFVAMIAYGDISADEITKYQYGLIDGIRLTFHNSEWKNTRQMAIELMEKGYKIFIQPVGTISYTDEQLLYLVNEVNSLNPYAFYIVDTLGSMYRNDLLRLFFLIENNLSKNILLGFHSHNNMQLSFANAMTLLEQHTNRHVIIDSSIFGMGRGAGNLNTELITHYINNNMENRYNLIPLLELIDDVILPIYKYSFWGFSEPYYLSAIMGVHPNYATYLIDKQSVGMTKIAEILKKLTGNNKHIFKKSIIEELYHTEMSNSVEDSVAILEISKKIKNRNVLVIAPGSNVKKYSEKIKEHIKKTLPFIISLNFVPEDISPDLVFISNRKRYEQLHSDKHTIAVTSNIAVKVKKRMYVIDYNSLIKNKSDSSGIMLLRFLLRLKTKHAVLAGYDGFTNGTNHYNAALDSYLSAETIIALNSSIGKQLAEIRKLLSMEFITPTAYNVKTE